MKDVFHDAFFFYDQEKVIIRMDSIPIGSPDIYPDPIIRTYFSMYYVISGEYYIKYNGEILLLKKGDLIIADYNSTACLGSANSPDTNVFVLDFLSDGVTDFGLNCTTLSELFNNTVFKNVFTKEYNIPKDYCYHDDTNEASILLNKVLDEYKKREFGYMTAIKIYIQNILLIIFRDITKYQKNLNYSYYVQHVVDYIKSNYNKAITLSEISSNFGYSLPYISNRFKHEVGMPFVKYLQNYRINEAAAMLRLTDYSIRYISEAVGLYNLKYFEEKFKEIVGMTPIKHRKMCKKTNPVYKV